MKGSISITGSLIIMVLLAGLLLFIANNMHGGTISSINNSVLGTFRNYFDSNQIDELPSIANSADFLDVPTSKYARGLTVTLFDNAEIKKEFPNGFLISYPEPSRIRNVKEDWIVTFSSYDREVEGKPVKGVAVTLDANNQLARVATPRYDDFLIDKSLCVLPLTEESTDEYGAIWAIHQITRIPIDSTKNMQNLDTIIESAKVSSVEFIFSNDDVTLSYTGKSKDSDKRYLAMDDQEDVLFLEYGDTICFLPVRGFKALNYRVTYNNGELQGRNSIHPELVQQLLDLGQIKKIGDFNENE